MWLGWSSEGKELWPLNREPVVSPPLARGQTKSSLQLDGAVGEGGHTRKVWRRKDGTGLRNRTIWVSPVSREALVFKIKIKFENATVLQKNTWQNKVSESNSHFLLQKQQNLGK